MNGCRTVSAFRPQVPEHMPAGLFFLVWIVNDGRGHKLLVVSLEKKRRWWFSKQVATSSFHLAQYHSLRHKTLIEEHMKYALESYRTELHRNTYLLGRHP